MTEQPARGTWRGRIMALVGIVLFSFSLRSAVASLSPVMDHIQRDFDVSSFVIGLIGTAPPVCFALFGLITPLLAGRFGLERIATGALVVVATGLLLRGFSVDSATLLFSTVLVFAGVGAGNVLLPPVVKKYFPDRLGVMMTVYSTTMAVSTFVPPMVAVPVADAVHWRASLGMWGLFAVAAIIPWIAMLLRERAVVAEALVRAKGDPAEDWEAVTGPISTVPPEPRVFARLRRLPLAWALAVVFGASSTAAYVSFAWLPSILMDLSGVSSATAGTLLSVFGFVGLPCSLLVPVLVVRFSVVRSLFFVGVASGLAGLAGLLFAPAAAPVLWVTLYGLTCILFPLSLVLMTVRARSHNTAVALSGFVQSFGYAIAALFPVLVGVLHEVSGGWQLPLIVLAVFLVAAIPAGAIVGTARTVEDEWELRHGSW